jgi:hypothetical protein
LNKEVKKRILDINEKIAPNSDPSDKKTKDKEVN